ncbi:AI-2E family transporter [Amphibacillus sp. Q70]|uniref:AI-2E family transporter n=1 Tax=Amphibacillus sp. Q70 TaxID=3453416 RepID=UPI003F872919
MIELTTTDYKAMLLRILNIILIISLSAVIIFLITKYLFPFIIVIGLSALLQKPVQFIKRVLKVNHVIAVLISLSLILATIIIGFGLIIIYLIDIFDTIIIQFPFYFNTIIEAFKIQLDHFVTYTLSNLEQLLNRLNFSLTEYLMNMMDSLYALVLSISQKLANQLVPFVSETIIQTIEITSTSIIVLILTVLLSKDWQVYLEKVSQSLPQSSIKKIAEVRKHFINIGWGYLKAQLIVSSVTTLILLIGFNLLKIENALALAFTFGLIDLVPLIGVGLLLWPWMIYSLITGGFILTIKLSVIYIIIVCVRQLLEPRLVSKQIGSNSLFVIGIGYLCYSLFGIFGLLFTPLILISVQTIKASELDQIMLHYIRFGKQLP